MMVTFPKCSGLLSLPHILWPSPCCCGNLDSKSGRRRCFYESEADHETKARPPIEDQAPKAAPAEDRDLTSLVHCNDKARSCTGLVCIWR